MANEVTNKSINNVPKSLTELNLMDKFLFDETMEDTESYQAMVSILLENEIELLEKPETEKELRVSSKLREVRLDVVSVDKEGTIYYTEMQQSNTGNLPKRSRYYQAQLDVSLLEPGIADFNKLNDSCFILIAPFDMFGKGLFRYTFEGVCRECPDLKLNDGAIKVFINTKGTNREDFSEEFLDFMDYLTNTNDKMVEKRTSFKIQRIHKQVKKIRLSERMGVRFMQRWEELAYARQEGEEIGFSKGEEAGEVRGKAISLINIICKKISKGETPEEIASDLEEEFHVILPLYEICKEFAPEYDCEKIYKAYCEKHKSVEL